jgi:RNA polymerase sigma-70 factor (ECF subfamily)
MQHECPSQTGSKGSCSTRSGCRLNADDGTTTACQDISWATLFDLCSATRDTILGNTVELALRENWQRLFGYAFRLSGSREAAGDLLQSCASKALASHAVPVEPSQARAWLFKVLRNCWIDDHRRFSVRAIEGPAEIWTQTPWDYNDRLIAEITVKQALEKIEPAHREIVERVDIAGFRYAEAAEILDLPVGTVMSRLSRARLAMLALIEGHNVMPIAAGRRRAR